MNKINRLVIFFTELPVNCIWGLPLVIEGLSVLLKSTFSMLNQLVKKLALTVALLAVFLTRSGLAYADGTVLVELNKLESLETGCHAYLVSHNKTTENFTELVIDLVIFQEDGIIDKVIGVSLAPLPPNKTGVKVFNLQLSCNRIGRLLINDVTECRNSQGTHTDCRGLLFTSPRASAELTK